MTFMQSKYSADITNFFPFDAEEEAVALANDTIMVSPATSIQGVKHSGLGREGERQGIEDYLEMKYVCLDGFDQKSQVSQWTPPGNCVGLNDEGEAGLQLSERPSQGRRHVRLRAHYAFSCSVSPFAWFFMEVIDRS